MRGSARGGMTLLMKKYEATVSEMTPSGRYFFGSKVTRDVTACPFNIPPRMIGPTGVITMPPLSVRGSAVFSEIVSHRLPCKSYAKLIAEGSAGWPS